MTLQKPLSPPPNGLQVFPTSEQADLAMSPSTHGLDLVVLLRILRVRRQVILGTAAAVIALAVVILFQLTPYYSAASVVMLDQRKNSIEDVSSVLSGMPTDPTGVQNQVQILTSRDIAGHVIDKLDLKDNVYFSGASKKSWRRYLTPLNPLNWFPNTDKVRDDILGVSRERNRLIDLFESRLTVTPLGLSTAIKLTYEARDPYDAAAIDNAIADAYVEDQLNAKFEATQKATKWLADRIQDLSKQSQAANEAVQQYRAANGLTETQGGGSVVDQQMSAIRAQMGAAKSDLAEKQA